MGRPVFHHAREDGLWTEAYCLTNANEFFAELTMWYFDSRGDYGKIKPLPKVGVAWFRKYDPESYKLVDRIYTGKLK